MLILVNSRLGKSNMDKNSSVVREKGCFPKLHSNLQRLPNIRFAPKNVTRPNWQTPKFRGHGFSRIFKTEIPWLSKEIEFTTDSRSDHLTRDVGNMDFRDGTDWTWEWGILGTTGDWFKQLEDAITIVFAYLSIITNFLFTHGFHFMHGFLSASCFFGFLCQCFLALGRNIGGAI